MSAAAFLAELRRHDIQVWAEGGQLRCNAPAGALAPDLREQLRRRKGEILAFLRAAEDLGRQQRAIVPLQPRGKRIPVFAVPGHNGDVFCYRALARHLGNDQPFFGLQPPGLDGHGEPLGSVESLAAYFAEQIRAFHPDGPCVIAGYCAGGTIAFELARQLQRQGATIRFVALFASPYPGWYRFFPQLRQQLAQQMERMGKHLHAMAFLPWGELRLYFTRKLHQRKLQRDASDLAASDPVLLLRTKVEQATLAAVRCYIPQHFAGRVSLFLPSKEWLGEAMRRWRGVARDIQEYCGSGDCDGDRLLREPHVAVIAELFQRCREKSETEARPRIRTTPERGPRAIKRKPIGPVLTG